MDLELHSHSRKNALNDEWVLVSPHRTARPWHGQIEPTTPEPASSYEPECYLCPGNLRSGGIRNPEYRGAYLFDNDFSALSTTSNFGSQTHGLFQHRPEAGCCRVVCYSEEHDLRLATMSTQQVSGALHALFEEFVVLDQSESISYVQIFENRGEMMGCSNPHPHAQIWATGELPTEPAKELEAQRRYWSAENRPLLAAYLEAELKTGDRVVCENEHFVVVVPYWALWPFETLLLPRRSFAAPDEMSDQEVYALADVLQRTLAGYDKMFDAPAPYSMGFHPRPSDGQAHPEWVFHAHIFPPLLRSATIRKHLVGFEMLAMPQRDLTPELAAKSLISCIE